MPFFVHEGTAPTSGAPVDQPDIHPNGMFYPGQVVRADVNPDPSVFREVPGGPEVAPTGVLADLPDDALSTPAVDEEPAVEAESTPAA